MPIQVKHFAGCREMFLFKKGVLYRNPCVSDTNILHDFLTSDLLIVYAMPLEMLHDISK